MLLYDDDFGELLVYLMKYMLTTFIKEGPENLREIIGDNPENIETFLNIDITKPRNKIL